MSDKTFAVVLTVAVALMLFFGVKTLHDWAECGNKDGLFIRTMTGYACVEKDVKRI